MRSLPLVIVGVSIGLAAGPAAAEPTASSRFQLEATLGHLELGTGAGRGLNAAGARALALSDRGLLAQVQLAALEVRDEVGLVAAALAGYRSRGRLWLHASGGVGVVRYPRIDTLLGGTQSGDPRDPADWLAGLAFDLATGIELWRAPDWAIDAGVGLDGLLSGPSVSVFQVCTRIGVAWR